MDRPRIRVLIVSLPGLLQRLLVNAFGQKAMVDVIDTANGALSAVNLIEREKPDLVVIDSNIPESEAVELINILRRRHPGTYNLVLADTSQTLRQAVLAGADLALRAPDLESRLDGLLVELEARLAQARS